MRKNVLALSTILSVILSSGVQAAPITFNTALPVSRNEIILRGQFIYSHASDKDRDREILTLLSVMAYGITPDLAVFGVLPLTKRKLDVEGGADREAEGPGDMRLFGRYTVYQRDFRGGTFRIAPFGGVEVPTGENDEHDEQGLLPPGLQTGSGSWDLFGGVVTTYATTDFNVDAQLSYQNNRKADSIELGDIWRADTSFQYRILPWELTEGTSGFLFGVLETNLVHQEKTRIDGNSDPDTGGTKLFVTPGFQYASRRWIAETAVQIPVAQDLNGMNIEQDYIVRTGIRVNF